MHPDKQRILIKKIEMENVGRFYGSNHSIEFSDSSDQNISIVIGLSGRGKSTIHDMIYWCLYGEHKKHSTAERTRLDYGLMNTDVLENLSKGENAIASITIDLHDNNGQKYLLTRELKATYNKDSTARRFDSQNNSQVPSGIEFETSVKLRLKDESGEMILEKNPPLIKNEINKHFPQHLSDFFLFDGENLEHFYTSSSSDFIKDGITKISGLEILNSMTESAKNTSKNIERSMGSKSANAAPYSAKAATLNEKISELEFEISEHKKSLEKAERMHTEYSEKIQQTKEGNKLVEDQKKTQRNKDSADRDLRNINEKIKSTLFERIPQLLIRDTLQNSEHIFARLEDEDKIPPSISRSAIDKILGSSPLKCVCGREFDKNEDTDSPWMTLTQIKDAIIEDDISQGISLGRDLISRIIDVSNIEKSKKDYEELIDSRRSKRKEIQEFDVELADLNRQIKNVQYNTDEDLGSLKTQYLDQCTDQKSNINSKTSKLDELMIDSQENNKRLKDALDKEGKFEAERKKIDLADAVVKFTKILEKKIEEILRKHTEQATSKYFLESAPEKQTFSCVSISENYEIVARDSGKLNASLSKGQSHVLGLSYVAGIREITHTNAFLIIDSPLHNISGKHRNEISQVFSKYLPGVQIVLLVTDTEYLHGDDKGAEPVRNILRRKGKVWKEYKIEATKVEGIESRQIMEYDE